MTAAAKPPAAQQTPAVAPWRPVTESEPDIGAWVRGRWNVGREMDAQRGPDGWLYWSRNDGLVRIEQPDGWIPLAECWGYPAPEAAQQAPAPAASIAELRTALAVYGKHTEVCAAVKWAAQTPGAVPSARHAACDCGMSSMIEGGPATGYVKALVGCNGLGTERPAPAPATPAAPVLAHEPGGWITWLVVRQLETDPPEVFPFRALAEAEGFYERAAQQWTGVYLCQILRAADRPHDQQPAPPVAEQGGEISASNRERVLRAALRRAEAERDTALVRLAALEAALSEAHRVLQWGHREMKGRPPQHWLDALALVARTVEGAATQGEAQPLDREALGRLAAKWEAKARELGASGEECEPGDIMLGKCAAALAAALRKGEAQPPRPVVQSEPANDAVPGKGA